MMKIIKISTEKQSNGVWAMPMLCYSIDSLFRISDRKMLIFSAICIAISEKYNERFSITSMSEHGFNIDIMNVGLYGMLYSKFDVFDNTLYEFNNDNEHNLFLRKYKLKKLYAGYR